MKFHNGLRILPFLKPRIKLQSNFYEIAFAKNSYQNEWSHSSKHSSKLVIASEAKQSFRKAFCQGLLRRRRLAMTGEVDNLLEKQSFFSDQTVSRCVK